MNVRLKKLYSKFPFYIEDIFNSKIVPKPADVDVYPNGTNRRMDRYCDWGF